MKIRCRTKFDITATGVVGHYKPSRVPFADRAGQQVTNIEQWNYSRNQQRNWETLIQLISLRTQVDLTRPAVEDNQWVFEITVDLDNVFAGDDDPLAMLKNDCDGVPMLTNLLEKEFPGTMLQPGINITFEII
jgi:hypothetical protein